MSRRHERQGMAARESQHDAALPLDTTGPTTHEHAKSTHRGVDGMEAQVAGREVKLLVIGWVIGDMHLTVFAGYGAIAFYHHRRVVKFT